MNLAAFLILFDFAVAPFNIPAESSKLTLPSETPLPSDSANNFDVVPGRTFEHFQMQSVPLDFPLTCHQNESDEQS